jgi:alanyl-tRNA synthetase
MPTEEEIKKIEALANNVIDNAIDIKVSLLPRNEAEKKYGFTLYQGGVPMTPTIRVVEIPGWDAQACFGTHVKNTSEVGVIKIVNVDKIADGVIRFEFVASTAIPHYIYQVEDKLKTVAQALSANVAEVDKKVVSFIKDVENLKNLVKTYRAMYINEILNNIENRVEKLPTAHLYIHKMEIDDRETLRDMIIKAIEIDPNLVFIGLIPIGKKTYIEISLGKEITRKIDARDIVKELTKELPIKAGGKQDHVTGTIQTDIEKATESIKNKIKTFLSK